MANDLRGKYKTASLQIGVGYSIEVGTGLSCLPGLLWRGRFRRGWVCGWVGSALALVVVAAVVGLGLGLGLGVEDEERREGGRGGMDAVVGGYGG